MKTKVQNALFILMLTGFICMVASFALRASQLALIGGFVVLVAITLQVIINLFDGQTLKN